MDSGIQAQNTAEALWREAKVLEALGQFEAAAPIEASAHAAQAAALVTLTTARTTFNTGFAALTAKMTSTPSMTGKAFDTYGVTGGHEKTLSKGPQTRPATPPDTPSSKPESLDVPKSALTQTPSATSQPAQDENNPSKPKGDMPATITPLTPHTTSPSTQAFSQRTFRGIVSSGCSGSRARHIP